MSLTLKRVDSGYQILRSNGKEGLTRTDGNQATLIDGKHDALGIQCKYVASRTGGKQSPFWISLHQCLSCLLQVARVVIFSLSID